MKVGDKYVIEIGEVIGQFALIKGFNALVFDQNGLDKLQRADKYCERVKLKSKQLEGGDEIIFNDTTMIVTRVMHDGKYFDAMDDNGRVYSCQIAKEAKPTGRHFKISAKEI